MRKGFTLIEILVVLLIISAVVYWQTATIKIKHDTRREAIRLREWLISMTRTARSTERGLLFYFNEPKRITAQWKDNAEREFFYVNNYFSISVNITESNYTADKGIFTPAFTLKITDDDDRDNVCYLIASVDGRTRLSLVNDAAQ